MVTTPLRVFILKEKSTNNIGFYCLDLKNTQLYHKIISYLRFIFKSKNHHGIHSPFIFNLVTKGFYKRFSDQNLSLFFDYKKELKNEIKTFKCNEISTEKGKFIVKLIQYLHLENILEIGTSYGMSTVAISCARKNLNITTLEECEEIGEIAKQMLQKYNVKNIRFLIGDYHSILKSIEKNTFDLIYLSKKHHELVSLELFRSCLPFINNNSVMVFENIHRSKEMERVWENVKTHSKVTVTVDTFQWGLVFFREEQQKEHFIIRI